ncbi:hypothetical protein ACQ4PT_012559 [Festuca glaucescens]
MASVEDDLVDNPTARFKMRFSVQRFEVVMRNLTPKQIGFLVKYGYDLILELKHKVVFPMVLIDWVMDNMVPELAMFRYEHKCIYFDKYMIQQFIGIPSGDTIAKISSKNPVIVDKLQKIVGSIIKSHKEKIAGDVTNFLERSFDLMSTEIFSAISKHCQPPPAETHFQPPPAEMHFQPPPAETHFQPPPAEMHYQPPPTETHSQPPTSETQFQPPTAYAVNKCTDLVEHTIAGDAKVGASSANDVDNYEGTTSNIVSSSRQEHAASDHDHFMDQHEDTVVKSSHCNEHVIELNKAPTDSNVTGDKRNCDAGTSTPQEEFPSDLVMKTHNEPILDKDKSKSDTSATIEIRDAKLVHSLDPEQTPSANIIIPKQDSVVSISSVADFSHPHYDESATSRDSVIKAKTLLDDAGTSTPHEDFPSDLFIKTHNEPILDKDKSKSDTSATRDSVIKAKTLLDDASASPKHVQFKDSGLSITDVVYISSQEQEVDHSVENVARRLDGVCISSSQQEYHVAIEQEHIAHRSKCIDAIGDVASTPPSSSPNDKAHSYTIKSEAKDCDETEVNRGIDVAMSDASEDPQSPFSNVHTPLYVSKLNVLPEKFNAKSVTREVVKMNKKFNFAKCELLHFPSSA